MHLILKSAAPLQSVSGHLGIGHQLDLDRLIEVSRRNLETARDFPGVGDRIGGPLAAARSGSILRRWLSAPSI
jgi:hypothetical protein